MKVRVKQTERMGRARDLIKLMDRSRMRERLSRGAQVRPKWHRLTDEYEEGSKWSSVGKVSKSGQAHYWRMAPKAEDGYCRFSRPYTAFPHRGDAPSSCLQDLKCRTLLAIG
jgi:hypothetical protein